MHEATFELWRGDKDGGRFEAYTTMVSGGMVVLDAIKQIQAEHANDLAVRWNCKAGKCGSCSAEINGLPRLMCMTRMSTLPVGDTVTVQPMKTFPLIRDLVTDVSWNYRVKKVMEFRKCIECYLCQDVCHVLREHELHDEFIGPRFMVYTAALEMHPLDTENRLDDLRKAGGIGYCNITKCCTTVCPENITITDNAIIPLKERVVDQAYDPLGRLIRVLSSDA
jgi:succinate dehydrogenase / fumarate reductase iron-sulfur subunit